MKAIAILSHLMDENGSLGEESLARIKTAIQRYKDGQYDFLFTSGWNYRSDTNFKIGDIVAEHLSSVYEVDSNRIFSDTNARDTVGDAFFLRRNLIDPFGIKGLLVVTSDYHVRRTDVIFKRFLSSEIEVETIGADLGLVNDCELRRREEASLLAFFKTFKGVNLLSDDEVFHTLQSIHPFYNGDVYDKIS